MKRTMRRAPLLLLLLAYSPAFADPMTAKVIADRVNLRAKPESTAEVVGQVSSGDVLSVKSVSTNWVEVSPPDSVELWVHKDFIADGKSSVAKLNVRAGPGVNYNVVGNLDKGEAVTVKGTFGEWLRIAPFPEASLWVSKEFAQLNFAIKKAPQPAPVAVVTNRPPPPPPPVAIATNSAPVVPVVPPPPADLVLIPLPGQGKVVEREGDLKPAPFVIGRPSSFRLVERVGSRLDTVCYLRGNSRQLDELMGQRLLVHGREYWAQGVSDPIVVVESIEKRAPSPTP